MRLLFLSSLNIDKRLRITNTFSLKVTFIELEDIGSNVRLYLKPKMPLISTEKSLPPRGEMHEYTSRNFHPLDKSLLLCLRWG
jgi:hypothetical protein